MGSEHEQKEAMDFTAMTCTNFMIKLKLLLKQIQQGEEIRVIATREQYQNMPKKIFKPPFKLEHRVSEANIHLLRISRS